MPAFSFLDLNIGKQCAIINTATAKAPTIEAAAAGQVDQPTSHSICSTEKLVFEATQFDLNLEEKQTAGRKTKKLTTKTEKVIATKMEEILLKKNKLGIAEWIAIISLFVSIVGILGGFWYSNKSIELDSKELTCTITDGRSLILKLTSNERFKILYDDQEIKNPVITTINIKNTGGTIIESTDFIVPFSVVFDDNDVVLSISVNSSINQYIAEEILSKSFLQGQKMTISDFLLSPGESFDLDIISDGSIHLNFDYRLKGISEIQVVEQQYSDEFVVWKTTPDKNTKVSIFMICMGGLTLLGLASGVYLARCYVKDRKEFSDANNRIKTLLDNNHEDADSI